LTTTVLRIYEAVALAAKGNRQVRSTGLSVDAAQQGTAALRTSRCPQFQTFLLGGEALRAISFSISEGALGVYPATVPIPPKDSKVTPPSSSPDNLLSAARQRLRSV